MISKEWITKMFGHIEKIDTETIANHIAKNDLKGWIADWKADFIKTINSIRKTHEKYGGWISLNELTPPEEEPIQVVIYNDDGDYPYTYTDTAWYKKVQIGIGTYDLWVSHDEMIDGCVVAWKKLDEPIPEKTVKTDFINK